MKIDQNGVPSVVAAESTETGQAIGAAVLETTTPTKSFGGIAADLLAQFGDAAVVVIDPNSRSVYAASGANGTALKGAALSAKPDENDHTTLTPDAGQSGKSLRYTQAAGADLSDGAKAAIAAAVEAAKPQRTIQSLVSTILGTGDLGDAAVKPVIIIDQIAGTVTIMEPETAAGVETALDAVANAGDRVKLAVSANPAGNEDEPLVFEGGSTGE